MNEFYIEGANCARILLSEGKNRPVDEQDFIRSFGYEPIKYSYEWKSFMDGAESLDKTL